MTIKKILKGDFYENTKRGYYTVFQIERELPAGEYNRRPIVKTEKLELDCEQDREGLDYYCITVLEEETEEEKEQGNLYYETEKYIAVPCDDGIEYV